MRSLQWAHGLGVALLAWCAGVALQLQQQALNDWPVYAAAVALALLIGGLLRSGKKAWGTLDFFDDERLAGPLRGAPWASLCRTAGLALVGWCLGWGVTGWHASGQSPALDAALEGQDIDVVGVVLAMPQRQDVGWRFRLGVEQAWVSGPVAPGEPNPAKRLLRPVRLPDQVYLGWYGQPGSTDSGWSTSALPEPVQAGERWRFRVRLKAPHGHLNPRGFDYELWLWEQGIRATGYVRTGAADPPPQRLAQTWRHPLERWRQVVRDRLLTRLASGASDPPGGPNLAGVVAALVTGDQAAIDRSDWDVFRATGVAHLMSISGLHVTVFAWLAATVLGWAWRKAALWGFRGALRWPAVHVGSWAGLALAAGYALFSGWGVPAQRTLCMLCVVVLLRVSARQWPLPLVWLFAAAVVLAMDPWALLQPGFWLSFVAVGVLMASDRPGATHTSAQRHADRTNAVPLLNPHLKWAWFRGAWAHAVRHGLPHWSRQLTRLLREQGVVTLSLAPLSWLFFGQVSLVGLLANLLAIPWVTFLVTPLALLGMVWPGAWVVAVWVLQPLVTLLGWMAAWPGASVAGAVPPWGLALLALVGAVVWVLRLPWSWKCMCLPLLWPALFWVHPRPVWGTFELLAADVGQGNAVLVRTAKHSLLYDAGPRISAESDAGHRVLVPLLAQMGERIDTLMLSHRDSDHTGGAAAVLAMQPQASLWSTLEDAHPLHALRPGWTRCQAGQAWVWDGVRFEVLHPQAQPHAADAAQPALPREAKPNAVSCVLSISDAHSAALLAGDIEAPQELALVQSGLAPADVLLVPHHGSKTSSSLPFLEAVQPRLALVQSGYRNRYGHPAPTVMARYAEQGIAVVESTRCGAAFWRSDAPTQVQCERERARRYWHHTMPP
ncbi:MAG: DNA internalization-related competence protein ComEC/Rec2 [Limnohabitans sp.]|nr:DNA internalization-related competence protein ComEC/Rec2 [Limnohabitans sp.]